MCGTVEGSREERRLQARCLHPACWKHESRAPPGMHGTGCVTAAAQLWHSTVPVCCWLLVRVTQLPHAVLVMLTRGAPPLS